VSALESIASFFDRRPAPPPPLPSVPELSAAEAALVAEACTRTDVVWVRPYASGVPRTDGGHRLAWHVWHDGAVVVVQGGGEQDLPPPAEGMEVLVPSKDAGHRLLTLLTTTQVLLPGSDEWSAAAQALSAARLNEPDPRHQRERWASAALVVRMTPVRVLAAGPGGNGTPSGAAAPVPTPATTVNRRPWHLGGRAGRGD